MNKLMLLGGAALLAVSGSAMAQSESSQPAPDASAAAPAPSDAAPPPAGAAAAPAPDAAAPAPAVAQSTAPAAASADATAKVTADWAKYDEGNKGRLTPLEFGNWVMTAKGQDVTAQVEKTKTSKRSNLPAIKVLNATSADFSKADTDKDKAISPNELAVFLSA